MEPKKQEPAAAPDAVDGDLCVTVQVRVADEDEDALHLISEGRKLTKQMVAKRELGAREAEFEIGRVRVTTSRAVDEPEPVPAAPESRIRWGYAERPNPNHWSGAFKSREGAIRDGTAEFNGDAFWIQRGLTPGSGEGMLTAREILSDVHEYVGDTYGEIADGYHQVSDEAEAELDALLTAWGEKYLHPEFWEADGEPEKIEPTTDGASR